MKRSDFPSFSIFFSFLLSISLPTVILRPNISACRSIHVNLLNLIFVIISVEFLVHHDKLSPSIEMIAKISWLYLFKEFLLQKKNSFKLNILHIRFRTCRGADDRVILFTHAQIKCFDGWTMCSSLVAY